MSQTEQKKSAQKLKIYSKQPGTLTTGLNTVIELDGKPVPYVTFLKLEFKPKNVVKVQMEMLIDVEEIELDVDLKEEVKVNIDGTYSNRKILKTSASEPVLG